MSHWANYHVACTFFPKYSLNPLYFHFKTKRQRNRWWASVFTELCKILPGMAFHVHKYFVTAKLPLFFRIVGARLHSIGYKGSNFLSSPEYDPERLLLLHTVFCSCWRFCNPFSMATHPFLNLVKTSFSSLQLECNFLWVETAVLYLVLCPLFFLFFF